MNTSRKENKEAANLRVVYSDGGSYYTSAQRPLEYMLDQVFIEYVFMSLVLYTSLMLALGIPFLAQVVLFGAGVVSSFFWLVVTMTINLALVRRGIVKAIYTPFLLLSMAIMNAFTIDFVLRYFGTSYVDGFNGIWEIAFRIVIIAFCLDIFYGKYVAHWHSKHVDPEQANSTAHEIGATAASSATTSADAQGQEAEQSFDSKDNTSALLGSTSNGIPETQASGTALSTVLKIANKIFDLSTIDLMESEDHYLIVHHQGQTTMVRGKLREVAGDIDVAWGVQVNRSAWVSFAAIADIQETSKGRLDVAINNGKILRVAESRRVFFIHNYDQYRSKAFPEPSSG